MKHLLTFFLLLTLFSCKKDSPECETWIVNYWQGRSDYTTVTRNYYPSEKDEKICGSGKDTVIKNNNYIISRAGINLYNYKTFIAKR